MSEDIDHEIKEMFYGMLSSETGLSDIKRKPGLEEVEINITGILPLIAEGFGERPLSAFIDGLEICGFKNYKIDRRDNGDVAFTAIGRNALNLLADNGVNFTGCSAYLTNVGKLF